jgi:uncharacterized protein YndB with AHSA1/START domain
MTESASKGASTRVSRIIHAPPKAIYEAFLDRDAVAAWLPPEGMTGEVHAFEAHEGGTFRLSLTYQDPEHSPRGKTAGGRDTVQGRFITLVPYEKIAESVVFESEDPAFAGEMTITWTLADVGAGTEVSVLCEDIPAGVRLEDNEAGSRSSLQKLAAFVE